MASPRRAAGLVQGADGRIRCRWSGDDPLYQAYHDTEWGRPVTDDARLFEKICLEGFQAGLSWITILRKREAFRRAFLQFHPEAVAGMGPGDVERLLADPGIVRHRGKIESAINNARRVLALTGEGASLSHHVWHFRPLPRHRPKRITWNVVRGLTQSPESIALSRYLKSRGWTFVGPTTLYAFMQSVGLVNDHVEGCHVRAACEGEQRAVRP